VSCLGIPPETVGRKINFTSVDLKTSNSRLECTDCYERWKAGGLTLFDAHQALDETRPLISELKGPTVLLPDPITNFRDVHGQILEDKELMHETIDEALGWPITSFLKGW